MVEELRILADSTIFDTTDHYVIPRYQRAYAWEDKEITQLIDDINGIDFSENYYIGSLVVARVKDKMETYEVVDGQQRLTTLYLLLQYLVSEGALECEVGKTLTFDCRANSNFTLLHIQDVLDGDIYSDDEERIEQSILNGIKVIRQKFSRDEEIDMKEFVKRLQNVVLYRIEVPENTDLNRYFEIMNTRGEQLEQHDILKAKLMAYLGENKRGEQEFFSRIWNACSDMTGYVQMHLSPAERQNIFKGDWNTRPSNKWKDYSSCFGVIEEAENSETLQNIISPSFNIDDVDGLLDDDTHIRFESIIDFPYFLLHSLRVFIKHYKVSLSKPFAELLDDKKLISDFDNVINNGAIGGQAIKQDKRSLAKFARKFIIHLLQTRYLFDMYIVKREYTGEDKEGEWSLKELHTSGQKSNKKPYYKNTTFRVGSEWENTSNVRCKENMMMQSALRVSYTSPKVMHWITNLLCWLYDNDSDTISASLIQTSEEVAIKAVKENFLDNEDFKLGVKTPHVVFNFLDYLLWKKNKNKDGYKDFVFEFRNSVEHWYPQNPSDGSFDSWDDKDTFGNLCIISRSVNSKFSNLSPESKMKSYGKMVKKGSLKLRLMGEIISNSRSNANEKWVEGCCQQHEDEMIKLLKEARKLLE